MSNVLRKQLRSNNPPAIRATELADGSADSRRHGESQKSLFRAVIRFFCNNKYLRFYCTQHAGGLPADS